MATTLKSRSRVISIRDTYSPRASRRNGLSSYSACSLGSGQKLYSRRTSNSAPEEERNEMAFTCKVQYLDDTDPFASTNFPEPTRPPSCTLHLNIPLCEQIAVLHKLLKAPHNVSEGISPEYCLRFNFGHLCASWRSDNGFLFSIPVGRRCFTDLTKWNVFGSGKYFGRTSRRFRRLSR